MYVQGAEIRLSKSIAFCVVYRLWRLGYVIPTSIIASQSHGKVAQSDCFCMGR